MKILLIMKLALCLMCISMISFAGGAFSQTVTVSVTARESTIIEIFRQIEETSQIGFFFKSDQLDLNRKYTVSFENSSVNEVLGELLGDGYSYKFIANNVVITRNNDYVKPDIQQQQRSVKGRVTTALGEPVPGASVIVKGTTTGTVTDINGNFSMPNVPANAILVCSFIGMRSMEVEVAGKAVIDIALEEETIGLDEVVAIGYGTQKKVNLTGAITAVGTEEIRNISASNLSNTLAGRAPGVNITGNSGLAGASSEIRIRGATKEPLYVIDGVVRDKDAFDNLEANEVEQISFLKDAATASIYGSRAGNGVVLVITKKGEMQKPMFSYSASYTTTSTTMELFSSKTTAVDELIYQNRVAEYQGTAIPNGDVEFDYFKDKNYDVNDYIWQNPWNQKHSLSVSGGSDKITYYALASYRQEEGSYVNLEYDKYNLRSNVSAKITDKIALTLNMAMNQQNQNRFYWPFEGEDEQTVEDLYRCTFNWRKTYPFYLYEDGAPANEVTPYPVQTPMGSWQAWNVIDQVIGDRYVRTREREAGATLTLDVDLGQFLPGLSAKVMGNYIGKDYMRKRFLTYQHNYVFVSAEPDHNRFIPEAPDPNNMNTFTFSQNQEFLSYTSKTGWSSQLNWFINYENTFGRHAVSAMAGWEQGQEGEYEVYTKAENPLTNLDQNFVYSTDSEMRWGSTAEKADAHLSWIGRFNYNYDQKYIAEFSFRYDGNTLFPKNKRWGFFPSFSAAWRVNNESFMAKTSGWLDNLKIRASYGTTGNDQDVNDDDIAKFSYTDSYQSGSSYIFGDDLYLGITTGSTANPNLTWATTTTYNAGLDFGVMSNRLAGAFDYFYKTEEDILGYRDVTVPDTYGQSLAPENYAQRSWRGIEFSAIWRDKVLGGKLLYSVYGNVGYSKDKWDKIDQSEIYQPGGNLDWASALGKPKDRVISLKTLGMVRTQEQLDELKAGGVTQYGRSPYLGGLYFEDVAGDGYSHGPDGKIDANDIQLLSEKGAPRINYGFGFDLAWRNFSLNAHFQGVGAYDRAVSASEGEGIYQHGGTERPYYPIWTDDVWTPENPNAKYPRPVGQSWYESGCGVQSFWIRSGAYLRLKTLDAGYTLPKKLSSFLKINEARVFFNGTNLLTFSEMKEFHDPEQENYDSYPIMKSFTFGVDIKF